MMLIISGLPQKITHNDLKKIIQEECYISEYLLSDFLHATGDKKKVKICVTDDLEADVVRKGLDGYKLFEHALSVAPVPTKMYIEQNIVNTTTAIPCVDKNDNQVSSTVKEFIKVKDPPVINKSKKKKKKARKTKCQRLAAKKSTMKDSCKQTPFMIGDLIKCTIKSEPGLACQSPVRTEPKVINKTSSYQQKENSRTETSVSIKQETRKHCTELTKADELVMTMMHEHKRSRWDVSTTASIDGGSCICVAITSGLTGHLSRDAVDVVLDSIHQKLAQDSKLETMINVPVFKENPMYTDGVVKLFCSDRNTFDWLESVVVNPEYMAGMPLTINRVDYKGKFLIGLVIPNRGDVPNNPRFILRLLYRQNIWIDVQSWQFVGSVLQKNNYFMKVLIPRGHMKILVGRQQRMAYSLGSVYVKFLGVAKM